MLVQKVINNFLMKNKQNKQNKNKMKYLNKVFKNLSIIINQKKIDKEM